MSIPPKLANRLLQTFGEAGSMTIVEVLDDMEARIQRDIERATEALYVRLTSEMRARFAEQDARIDTRFAEMDARINVRFAEFETKLNTKIEELRSHVSNISWQIVGMTVAIVSAMGVFQFFGRR